MTTQKLYLPSHTLYLTLHPRNLCHQIHCINYITPSLCMILHTICMTSHSVCMTSYEHFMTSHHIGVTSHPVYLWHLIQYIWYHPYCYHHENKTTLTGISPTVFDITATASLWPHLLYQCRPNNYGSLHTWHTYDNIHTLHHTNSDFMTSIVSIKNITNTVFMTSHPLYMTSHPRFMTSHPLYLWHHSHYNGNITPTMFVNTYQLYLRWNTLC